MSNFIPADEREEMLQFLQEKRFPDYGDTIALRILRHAEAAERGEMPNA